MRRFLRGTLHKRAIGISVLFLGIVLVAGMTVFAATNISSDLSTAKKGTEFPYMLLPSGATPDTPHQRVFDAMATDRSQAIARATQSPHPRKTFAPPPTLTPAPTFTPVTAPYVAIGIIEAHDLGPYARGVRIANRWEGYVNGQYVTVFAGKISDTAKDGFVGVTKTKFGEPFGDPTTISTPTQHGSVKITAVNMYLFTLTAEDGTVFTFDVQTLTFK